MYQNTFTKICSPNTVLENTWKILHVQQLSGVLVWGLNNVTKRTSEGTFALPCSPVLILRAAPQTHPVQSIQSQNTATVTAFNLENSKVLLAFAQT